MTTATKKKLRIRMSEQPPVSVVADDWPVVASDSSFNGEHECQANRIWWIKVRQHADGRRIVYGCLDSGPGGTRIGWRGAHGGFLVAPSDGPEETIRAIRRVAGIIDDDAMADYVIAALPATDLT